MIEESLKKWLLEDAKIEKIKLSIDDLKSDLKNAEKEAEDARLVIQEEMASTGEYEVNVSGEYCDYRIYFPTPRTSVKVADVDAVPDKFCKVERVPKLNDIKDYLKTTPELPNWVTLENSIPKLTYKIQKKKG